MEKGEDPAVTEALARHPGVPRKLLGTAILLDAYMDAMVKVAVDSVFATMEGMRREFPPLLEVRHARAAVAPAAPSAPTSLVAFVPRDRTPAERMRERLRARKQGKQ